MKPKQPKQECLCALVNGQCEKCAPKPTETWRELLYRLDIGDPDSKGCTITLGEYLRIDCPELESFIQSEIDKAKEEGETLAIQRVRNFNFGELGKQMEKYINEAKREILEEIERRLPKHMKLSYCYDGQEGMTDEEVAGFNIAINKVHAIIKQIKN